MKLQLFDFQLDALKLLRAKVSLARAHSGINDPQAIAFSAPTGSGKTIVMTALFEQILSGSADLEAQQDAIILWVSDMPELNEQTRLKIEAKSDRIRVRQLVNVDGSFDSETFPGGCIYFLNTQKLGSDKLLTKVGDGRKFSVWTTLANTARAAADRFYVVIDEAHRGMGGGRAAKEARTLMQRLLLGYPDDNLPKMPLVIGISATPRRFMDLLENAPHTVHKVVIPTDEVRVSGLLKDRIVIHHPETATNAQMSLLEEAARRWDALTQRWKVYCDAEQEARVWPILVVQIENGTDRSVSRTDLHGAMDAIEAAIGRRLNEGEIAHAMHDVADLDIGGRLLRRVEASRIDDNREIGVVFFKTSLSTGWDCPRAEVMISFRKAEDHTYIAQLLGRMVRSPLARRIERDAELNDVHLFVPHFDAKAVEAVVTDLQDLEAAPPTEAGSSRDLVVLDRSPEAADAFGALDDLVTYRVNAVRVQSNLKRYLSIARALTVDDISASAWDDAKLEIVSWMAEEVSRLKALPDFEDAKRRISHVSLRATAFENGSLVGADEHTGYVVQASALDVDRLFDKAGRVFGNGLHMTYWEANALRVALDVKAEAIILSEDHESMLSIEKRAESAFNALYDNFRRDIGKLREQRRAHYDKLRISASNPAEISWMLPEAIDHKRSASAPSYPKHMFVESDGFLYADLGGWEHEVITEELQSQATVAWLRNFDRKPWSLEIPYRTGSQIRPMFPDFLLIRAGNKGDLIADILEPHDPSLADNFEKAVGLAEFAERHGHLFGRIQLIRKLPSPAGGEKFRRLDLNVLDVQRRVKLITSNPQLDEIFLNS